MDDSIILSIGSSEILVIQKKVMLTKQQVISAIKLMPDTFDTTQLFDRIILRNKIEEGRKQIKVGNTYTTEGAKKKLKKWLK